MVIKKQDVIRQYYVEALTDATNEQVTLCLDEAGESTPTNTKQTIRVGKRTIYGVYFVPEEILRKLLK